MRDTKKPYIQRHAANLWRARYWETTRFLQYPFSQEMPANPQQNPFGTRWHWFVSALGCLPLFDCCASEYHRAKETGAVERLSVREPASGSTHHRIPQARSSIQ